MTLQPGDKLMSLTDVSEMLGIPLHTLYRWRHKGDGPVGYRVGRHVRWLDPHGREQSGAYVSDANPVTLGRTPANGQRCVPTGRPRPRESLP